ncbi:hypothetical protein DXT99_20320 [Pontibacter diazotrophicus]|uniref:Uncharacterized protein n=1 Tax=Pontibacter diazotrophicus TaxID=1400979 RepID=A0A3D8L7U5_9BACT|nr:hypothetical protein DXT99_20320 [Pontibacter diazotrophicus]
MFKNQAGPEYDEKLKADREFFLASMDSIQKEQRAFVIDTMAAEKDQALNYTLVFNLENRKLNKKYPLFHSLILKPNRTDVQPSAKETDFLYSEFQYYTHDSLFYTDMNNVHLVYAAMGNLSKLMPTQKLYEPSNTISGDPKSFAVDSLSFSPGFTKKQQQFFRNVVNNAFVVRQTNKRPYNILMKKDFHFHPNFLSKAGRDSADYTINFHVSDDPEANKIIIKLTYSGEDINVKIPSDLSKAITLNRQDFLDGRHYEANLKISRLIPNFILMQYMFD